MRRRLAAIALLSGLAAAGAHAQDVDCHARDLTQMDINYCAGQALEKQDRELNQLYGQLVKAEDPAGLKKLQAAQRAWLQFRDLECVFETTSVGGSLAPYETATCKAEVTKARVGDLKRVLRDQVH